MPTGILKRVVLRLLPPRLLHLVNLRHQVAQVRRFELDKEPDLEIVRHLVTAGDLVIDLGANYGIYTRFLSAWVGAEGLVIAVEPIPETHQVLRRVVERLALGNVEIINAAISDKVGTVQMVIPRSDGAYENYYQAAISDAPGDPSQRSYNVRTTTVDEQIKRLRRPVRFIKCDVEGHELQCIQGSAWTLQNHKPAWLIEVSADIDDQTSPAAELVRILSRSDYSIWWFDRISGQLRERQVGERSVNYFFLQPVHVLHFREQGLIST